MFTYSVSMPPSIVFISIDLCMDYVNRLYCNKWEKRDDRTMLIRAFQNTGK